MGKVLEKITQQKVLVSDGAWGTFLHQKGLKADECPELWNMHRSDDVLQIARSYVEAGADIILTNSFGASPIKLEGYGLEEGSEANLVLFQANSAADALRKQPERLYVIRKGEILVQSERNITLSPSLPFSFEN